MFKIQKNLDEFEREINSSNLNLAELALRNIFPSKFEQRKIVLKYSGRFSDFNANIKYGQNEIILSLSSAWEKVSPEIQMGIVESLFCKMYGVKKSSTNQDLYRSFMKNLSKFSKTNNQDEYLKSRFDKINDDFFLGLMSAPNLSWGQYATTKLGHYDYSRDGVVISSVFEKAPFNLGVEALLDFVLYHELLHKKHKYDHKKERARHHTRAFRIDEKKWPDKDIEKKLTKFLRKKRLKRAFFG